MLVQLSLSELPPTSLPSCTTIVAPGERFQLMALFPPLPNDHRPLPVFKPASAREVGPPLIVLPTDVSYCSVAASR